MPKFPLVREAKSHAKHLSKTFNVKLSDAQEIVAFRYETISFSRLLELAGQPTTKSHRIDMYEDAPEGVKDKFVNLVSPFENEISAHIDHRVHVNDSVLKKIADGKYSQISPRVMDLFTTSDEVDFSDSASIIEYLEFIDDSVTRVLASRKRYRMTDRVNLWIRPWNYGHQFYAYFNFSGDNVDVVVREWDLDVEKPTKESDISSRPWFVSYMLEYLELITKQLTSAGYSGTVRVACINNLPAGNLYYGTKSHWHSEGVNAIFNSLLANGGNWDWDEDSEGNKNYIGVKIKFGEDGEATSYFLMPLKPVGLGQGGFELVRSSEQVGGSK